MKRVEFGILHVLYFSIIMHLSQDLKLSLTSKEGWMINQTLNVPLYGFELEKFKKEIGDLAFIESLNEKLRLILDPAEGSQNTVILHFQNLNELSNFRKAFFAACEIAEQWEFPILTGYSWEESRNLMKDMDSSI